MYYKDLSVYEYLGIEHDNVLNVGWIDKEHSFPKGDVPKKFLSNLLHECVNNMVNLTRGFHHSPFLGSNKIGYPVRIGLKKYRLGSGEIRVPGKNGIVYAAPNLIYHYVKDCHYQPPQEFIDAVLALKN
jgi:hypothetical protein